MPPSKKRDYKQERRTAIARGETGIGSKSGDATRHRARRKLKNSGVNVGGKDVTHKNPLKSGGSNSRANLTTSSVSKNRAAGGRSGDRAGKSRGGSKSRRGR